LKKLSIIVPVYQNEKNLPDTIPELLKLREIIKNYSLELIFIDDGSKDNSFKILTEFKEKHPDIIKVVKLTRNFGAPAAGQAGIKYATGDCIGKINADLQDPPELFVEMIKHWEKGFKAIFAIRKDREDTIPSKIAARGFYSFLRRYAISDYPKGGFDFFIIERKVADEFNKIKEKNTNINTLIFWLGFDYVTVPYTRKERKKGKSTWTFTKKIKYFVDTFVGFSYFPIKILSLLGIVIASASFIYGLYILYNWSTGNIQVEGWTTIMIILTFTAGIQMMMIGIIGEYLWRTLDEIRNRPTYVVDEVY